MTLEQPGAQRRLATEGFKWSTAIDGQGGCGLRLALVAILLFIVLALIIGGSAQAYSAAAPRYTTGDHWDYAVTGSLTYAFNGTSVDFHVSGSRSLRVSGVSGGNATTVEVASVKVNGSFSTQAVTETIGAEVNSTRTITPSTSDGVFFVNVTLKLGYTTVTQRLQGTFTSTVRENTVAYPLESGHRYRTVTHVLATLDLGPGFRPLSTNEEMTTEYVAGASESVSVKAGTFTALPLASWTNLSGGSVGGMPITPGAGNGGVTRMYYAPDTGNYVKTVSYNPSGQEVAREELVTYGYANGPNRFLQILSEPVIWVGTAGVGTAAVVAGALIIRRRRAPALPPQPSATVMAGAEGLPPHTPAPPEGPVPEPPGAPTTEGEEKPPSGP